MAHIEFPDNQDSLDLIGNHIHTYIHTCEKMIGYVTYVYVCMYVGVGIFKVLDDQCRIPNPSDKRFASQMYKEYGKQMYVCMYVYTFLC